MRVLDMTALISGPLCSQVLADLGAEVIRVESAGSDVMRFVAPLHQGMSAFFEQVNRGKKSITVDLKSDEGRAMVHKLADSSDIFLQNSRPGVMERLGFGYEALRKSNPRLIYVAISGFGETGPFVNRPAYDAVIQGITGFMPIQGGVGGDPVAIRSVIADKITAMSAANATVAALYHRDHDEGRGQKVSVNMASAFSAFMLVDQMHDHTFVSSGMEPTPRSGSLGSYRLLDTADGQVIGMVLQPSQCERFLTALGRPDMVSDERFATMPSIGRHMDLLYDTVADTVAAMTTEAFLALMEENSIPYGKVNTTAEFLASPEALHSQAYVDVEDPELGTVRHLNYPARFERSPADATRRAPKLGEHNDEILAPLRQPAGAG
ncbi:MAG: CoA transferase [Phenylobacterium sp.]|uniref:CaiB/BaiF CoA transferase family protein n=1 Tax=Phenylobacterium sp. TaxID=1871053 RepID=UPI002733242D|nr:CoA transferase [Phenylobacterium sp.]MDP3175448.1 CoA transferase [Phenylobacterium sp.]